MPFFNQNTKYQYKMDTLYDLFRDDTILPFHVLSERAADEGLGYSQLTQLIARAKAEKRINESITATASNYELVDKEDAND